MNEVRTPPVRRQYGLCLWPGLAQLWLVGSWGGLVLAIGFALLLNLSLVVSVVWREAISSDVRGAAWLMVGGVWIASAVANAWWCARRGGQFATADAGDLFPQALGEYLQGNWFEAEALLGKLLRRNPRDAEAQLLWASLLRRTGRGEDARRRLDELSRWEAAERWQAEIRREQSYLEVGYLEAGYLEPTASADVEDVDREEQGEGKDGEDKNMDAEDDAARSPHPSATNQAA